MNKVCRRRKPHIVRKTAIWNTHLIVLSCIYHTKTHTKREYVRHVMASSTTIPLQIFSLQSNSHHPRLQWHRHLLRLLVCNCRSVSLIHFCRPSPALHTRPRHSTFHDRLCPLHPIPVVFALEVFHALAHCASEHPVFAINVFFDLFKIVVSVRICITLDEPLGLRK